MKTKRVTASGLVYLFAKDFILLAGSPLVGAQTSPANRGQTVQTENLAYELFGEGFGQLAGSLASGARTHLAGIGQASQTQSLAYKLFEAAFVSLAEQGYISLEMKKTSLPPPLARPPVTIIQQREGADLPPSLERVIMEALSGSPKEDRVPAVVDRVIQGKLRPPLTSSPQGAAEQCIQMSEWVVDYVIEELADVDYLWWEPEEHPHEPRTVRWFAYQEAVAPLAGEEEALKSTLEAFASANPSLRTRLVEEVVAGFRPETRRDLSDLPLILLEMLLYWLDSR
jgi:hypothetical protein